MENNVYDKIVATVNKNVSERLAEIEAQRKANQGDEEASEEVLARERGMARGNVFKTLDETGSRVGQVMLATLWEMHVNHDFELVYEAADAREYVEDTRTQYRDYYYARSLAQVVDLTLTYVEARKIAGKPVMDPETNIEITVEMLIGVPGTISKLKEQAFYINGLEKDEDKDALIAAIGTGQSRTKVESKRSTIEEGNTDEKLILEGTETIDPKTKKTIVTLDLDQDKMDYLTRTVLIASVSEKDDKFKVVFNLDDASLKRLQKAMGKTLVLHQAAPKKSS